MVEAGGQEVKDDDDLVRLAVILKLGEWLEISEDG